jgi:hypothetical protein
MINQGKMQVLDLQDVQYREKRKKKKPNKVYKQIVTNNHLSVESHAGMPPIQKHLSPVAVIFKKDLM